MPTTWSQIPHPLPETLQNEPTSQQSIFGLSCEYMGLAHVCPIFLQFSEESQVPYPLGATLQNEPTSQQSIFGSRSLAHVCPIFLHFSKDKFKLIKLHIKNHIVKNKNMSMIPMRNSHLTWFNTCSCSIGYRVIMFAY